MQSVVGIDLGQSVPRALVRNTGAPISQKSPPWLCPEGRIRLGIAVKVAIATISYMRKAHGAQSYRVSVVGMSAEIGSQNGEECNACRCVKELAGNCRTQKAGL